MNPLKSSWINSSQASFFLFSFFFLFLVLSAANKKHLKPVHEGKILATTRRRTFIIIIIIIIIISYKKRTNLSQLSIESSIYDALPTSLEVVHYLKKISPFHFFLKVRILRWELIGQCSMDVGLNWNLFFVAFNLVANTKLYLSYKRSKNELNH
jgi:hypothetical protein